MPNLTELDLGHSTVIHPRICFAKFSQIVNQHFIELISMCPSLTKLDISYTFFLSHDGLDAVLENCPKLAYLDMAGCGTNFSDIFPP